jgi:hypothetical protein
MPSHAYWIPAADRPGPLALRLAYEVKADGRFVLSEATVETDPNFTGASAADRGQVALTADGAASWARPWRSDPKGAVVFGGNDAGSYAPFGRAVFASSGWFGSAPENPGSLATIEGAASLRVTGTAPDGAEFAGSAFNVSDKAARDSLFRLARDRSTAALADRRVCDEDAGACDCGG